MKAEERPAGFVTDDSIEPAEPGLPTEAIGAPLAEDQPVAPTDESIAARLSEEAHEAWIQSITEQVGRMRREEGLRGVAETPRPNRRRFSSSVPRCRT